MQYQTPIIPIILGGPQRESAVRVQMNAKVKRE